MTTNTPRDVIARQLWLQAGVDDDVTLDVTLEALTDAGYAIVPVEADLKARIAGSVALDQWYTQGTNRQPMHIPASAFGPVYFAMMKAHEDTKP